MNLCESPRYLDTEIVIVGGGGAGLAAAVAAGEKGANVIVIEKRATFGGNSALATGIFAAESPVQKRMMIDARGDELFKKAMDYSHWKIDPKIVRAFVHKSGDTVGWLEEKGLKFPWVLPLYPNQVPPVLHCPEGRGAALVKVLLKNCEDLDLKLFDGTAAKRILISDQGKVAGVLAVMKEKEIEFRSKSVVIATGGFGGNQELLKRYHPSYSENRVLSGIPHMGDGLLMCTEIGAATEGLGLLLLGGPRVPGSMLLTAVVAEPSPILVNRFGERFSDEDILCHFERGNTVDRQPDKICYALLDAKIKQYIIEEGLKRPGWGLQRQVPHLQPQIDPTELEKDLQTEVEKGEAKVSNSWDEIATWIGVVPEVLKATVDEYNGFCDHGHDEMFVKDPKYLLPLRTPPYYAIKSQSGFLGTIGGIKISDHMEVLNHQGNPIPGLYAAGVDTGGWQGETYAGKVLPGSAFGFAINSGRIAGENAASYVLGK